MGRDGRGVKAGSASTIEITFSYRGVRCRERIALEPTPANLKRAERHKHAIEAAIASGTFDYGSTFPNSPRRLQFVNAGSAQTVERFLADFLASQKPMVKASTWDDYRKTINNVFAHSTLAKIPVCELDRAAIRQFCVAQTCGNKRLANILSVLRLALDQGVQDNVLNANVLAGWGFEKPEPVKESEDVDPLTADELDRVLSKLTPANAARIKFAFWTGMRPSEQKALLWSDIDYTTGEIRVTKAETDAATRRGTGAEAPKTYSGRRTIKMLSGAREALKDQEPRTKLMDGKVWASHTNKSANEIWRLACRKAGVRYRNPYQSRHTYASRLLSAGEPLAWVVTQMGHCDVAMLMRVYARYIPGSHPNAGAAVESMFAGSNASNMPTSAAK